MQRYNNQAYDCGGIFHFLQLALAKQFYLSASDCFSLQYFAQLLTL